MIGEDFKRLVAILLMKIKVIKTMKIMHEIEEIRILFIQSMLADSSNNPDNMRAECLYTSISLFRRLPS